MAFAREKLMALSFYTSNPSGLLGAFKKAIDQRHVTTWSYDSEGDFTHTPEQWKSKAWLRPKIVSNQLKLFILAPESAQITWEVYAVYHGRFIESMIAHCHELFDNGCATAKPIDGDLV
jgi:hypothetical protein